MKGALRWRRPAEVPAEERTSLPAPPVTTGSDPATQLQSRWTGGPALATKVATGALWTGLLTGPAALLLTFSGAFASTPPATRLVTPEVDRIGEQAAAAEFAGRLVTLWLTSVRGQEAQLTPLLRDVQLTLPQVAWATGPTTVADERRLPDGTWMVVTAVPVGSAAGLPTATIPGDSTTAPSTTWPVRYFQLPVHVDAGGPVALALPAPVAAPGESTQPPRLDYRYRAGADDPIGVSVTQFLAALLTGTGDVTRYVSPGSTIGSVTPAPYTAVGLTSIATDRELTAGAPVPADGTSLRALVSATVTAEPQQQAAVQYPLTLTVRGGRWEITAVDASPALEPVAPEAGSGRPDGSTPIVRSTPAATTISAAPSVAGTPSVPGTPSSPTPPGPTPPSTSPDPLLD